MMKRLLNNSLAGLVCLTMFSACLANDDHVSGNSAAVVGDPDAPDADCPPKQSTLTVTVTSTEDYGNASAYVSVTPAVLPLGVSAEDVTTDIEIDLSGAANADIDLPAAGDWRVDVLIANDDGVQAAGFAAANTRPGFGAVEVQTFSMRTQMMGGLAFALSEQELNDWALSLCAIRRDNPLARPNAFLCGGGAVVTREVGKRLARLLFGLGSVSWKVVGRIAARLGQAGRGTVALMRWLLDPTKSVANIWRAVKAFKEARKLAQAAATTAEKEAAKKLMRAAVLTLVGSITLNLIDLGGKLFLNHAILKRLKDKFYDSKRREAEDLAKAQRAAQEAAAAATEIGRQVRQEQADFHQRRVERERQNRQKLLKDLEAGLATALANLAQAKKTLEGIKTVQTEGSAAERAKATTQRTDLESKITKLEAEIAEITTIRDEIKAEAAGN